MGIYKKSSDCGCKSQSKYKVEMTELKILSMNVNGFSNKKKRETVIQTIERKRVDIIVLCDTRFRTTEHINIENEFAGYSIFFHRKILIRWSRSLKKEVLQFSLIKLQILRPIKYTMTREGTC